MAFRNAYFIVLARFANAAALALIRFANTAAQLPYGSGRTKGSLKDAAAATTFRFCKLNLITSILVK